MPTTHANHSRAASARNRTQPNKAERNGPEKT